MDDGHLLIDPPVEPRLIDADEFQIMVESGVFADEERKIELDDGRIVVAPMDGPAHLSVGERLGAIWFPKWAADRELQSRLKLYIPGGVRVSDRISRAPDAMLAPPGVVESGRLPTASEALLAVEFSDTTLKYDDGKKRADYARGGLAELWIVRVEHGDVRICRGARKDGSWDEANLHAGDALIAPLAAPALALRVSELFTE
jgi:Uma2 family endonuclease